MQLPPGEVPTGQTPNAKRPLDRTTIAVSTTGSRLMTQEDLSAGFHNLAGLQERGSKWAMSIGECVHYNSQLLNAVVHEGLLLSRHAVADALNILEHDEDQAQRGQMNNPIENLLKYVAARVVS